VPRGGSLEVISTSYMPVMRKLLPLLRLTTSSGTCGHACHEGGNFAIVETVRAKLPGHVRHEGGNCATETRILC
jgi:hypothetical protein